MRFALIAIILTGCTSFGSNITHDFQAESKSEEKISTAMTESRRTESPQPVSIHVTASGNANVHAAVPEISMQKENIGLAKRMSSDSWTDQKVSELWEQHSGIFYLIVSLAACLVVFALKRLEGTVTFKGMAGGLRVFGSVLSVLDHELANLSPKTHEFEAVRKVRDAIKKKESSLKGKAKPVK